MHLSEEVLQDYLDREMSEQQMEQINQHLAACGGCRETFAQVQQRVKGNQFRLDTLAPTAEALPDANILLAQLEARREEERMPRKSKWRSVLAAGIAIAALVAAFSFEPVRVWATEFLSLFRVQQVAVLRFDPANLQQLNRGLFSDDSERRIEQLLSDTARINKRGKPQQVQTVNEAARLAGFGIQMPAALQPPTRIQVHPAVDASFDIDVERLQGILDEAGRSDIRIPEEIDGEMLRVNVPASVTALFGSCPDPQDTSKKSNRRELQRRYRDCKILVQLPAPVVVAPPSLNVTELGTQILKIFGLTEEEARKFSESIDWATTLVIPLPMDDRTDFNEVDVNGVKGHLFLSREHGIEGADAYNLLWIRDGIVYSFMGRGTADEAIVIASSL